MHDTSASTGLRAAFMPGLGRRATAWASMLLIACASVLAGCSTLRSMLPGERRAEAQRAAYENQQSRNMRFADAYVGRLTEADRQAHPDRLTAQQRLELSGWMLEQANAVFVIAADDNPVIGTLDLVTLAVLSRMVVESTSAFGDHAQAALLKAHRQLEEQAWALASLIIDARQKEEVLELCKAWRAQNPGYRNVPFVRFQDFVGVEGGRTGSGGAARASGLFGLIGLDPLAGLDPAVRQVEMSRLLAERANFYLQRVPILLDLQLTRTLSRIAVGPESQKLQQQSASLTRSAEQFAHVAQSLPQTLATEREALIKQLSGALLEQQAALRPLLIELRGTLQAGDAMATSVDKAVNAIDQMVARFSPKSPAAAGTSTGKPFDITEYGETARQINAAAAQLQLLLGGLGAHAPQIDTAVGGAVQASLRQGELLVDYLYLRIAWLIGLLLAAGLVFLVAQRLLAARKA